MDKAERLRQAELPPDFNTKEYLEEARKRRERLMGNQERVAEAPPPKTRVTEQVFVPIPRAKAELPPETVPLIKEPRPTHTPKEIPAQFVPILTAVSDETRVPMSRILGDNTYEAVAARRMFWYVAYHTYTEKMSIKKFARLLRVTYHPVLEGLKRLDILLLDGSSGLAERIEKIKTRVGPK